MSILVSNRKVREKNKMANWKTEYQIDFHILNVRDGIKKMENSSLIIEGTSPDDVKQKINAQFKNIVGFSIRKITKIWEY